MGTDRLVALRGPILRIGKRVTIDCRFVDRVELASRFTDPAGLRLLVFLEETELSLEFPGTRGQAEDLIVAVAPYTRAAPLTTDGDFEEAQALCNSIREGDYVMPPIVSINGDELIVEGGLISASDLEWIVDDVLKADGAGETVELADKSEVPAALFALAIAASEPPNLKRLEARLAEFHERRRVRNPS